MSCATCSVSRPKGKDAARIELARKNSWEARFSELEEVLWRHM